MSDNRACYNDLKEAYWAIADALEVSNHPVRQTWLDAKFEELLAMCGWTADEWNEAVDNDRAAS